MTDPNDPNKFGPSYGSGEFPTGGDPQYGGGPQYGQQPGGFPGGAPGGAPGGTPPENNLVWAILTTIFCCLPLGVVAIIKASSVNNKWAMGDYAGAQRDADDAKKFALWGAIAGVVVILLYIVWVAAVGGFAYSIQ